MENRLPRWDLTPIFSGFDGDDFAQAIQQIDRLTTNFLAGGKKSFTTAQEVEQRVADITEIFRQYSSLSCFVHLSLSTNTSNQEALLGLHKVSQYQPAVTKCEVLLSQELAEIPNLEEFIVGNHYLEQIQFNLKEIAESVRYQMSLESEDLASDLAQSGADAWGRLQEVLTSQESIAWSDSEEKTIVELRSLATDADGSVRQRAYQKELELSKRHSRSMAAALNGIKQWNLTLNKRRGYTSHVEPALKASRMSQRTLDTLIRAMEKSLPMFQRYFQAKAAILGKESLPFFDLFAPVGQFSEKWSWERACTFIKEQYSLFHPAMGEFLDHALQHRWVDAPIQQGKVGGAFCCPLLAEKESRVLVNFDGYFSDVMTLAHELGHAYHSWVLKDWPDLQQNPPMPLAETASIFGETLVIEGALQNLSSQDQLLVLEESLQGHSQIIVDILSRYYFEDALFTRRSEGEVSADELCSMMEDAQRRTYQDGLDQNYLHPYMWFNKGHYYSADLPFYNYPYAFGGLFSLGIYAQAKQSNSDYGATYDTLLRATGAASVEDVAMSVGIDLGSDEFWKGSFQLIEIQIDQFIQAAKDLGLLS